MQHKHWHENPDLPLSEKAQWQRKLAQGWRPSDDCPPTPNLPPVYQRFDRAFIENTFRYGRLRLTRPKHKLNFTLKNAPSEKCAELTQQLAAALDIHSTLVSHTVIRPGALVATGKGGFQPPESLEKLAREARPFYAALQMAGIPNMQYNQYGTPIGNNDEHARERWQKLRKYYGHLIRPWNGQNYSLPEEIPYEELAFDQSVGNELAPQQAGSMGTFCDYGDLLVFMPNSPTCKAIARAQIAVELSNGASGIYWDVGKIPAAKGYGPFMTRQFREWLAETLGNDKAVSLFGKRIEELALPPMGTLPEILHKDIMLTTDQLDQSLHAPGDDAQVNPLLTAFIEYRMQVTAEHFKDLTAYGRSLSSGYVSSATIYIDDSGPHLLAYMCGATVNAMCQQGDGNSLLLWESTLNAPHRGFDHGEPREPWTAKTTDIERDHEPHLHPEVYGCRSNTSLLKFTTESAAPAPIAAKPRPNPAKDVRPYNQMRLSFAEVWANLAVMRVITGERYGVKGDDTDTPGSVAHRMNGFQARNEELFKGARRYDHLALWCSMQQARARRYDTSMGVSRMLTEADIEHRIINDETVNENRLDDLQTLILANVRVVTDEQIRILNRWARTPGNGLVLIGRNADRDEYDRSRPNGLDQLLSGVPEEHVTTLGEDIYPRLCHTGSYRIKGLGDDLEPLRKAVMQMHGPGLTYVADTPHYIQVHPLQIDSVEYDVDYAGTGIFAAPWQKARATVVHILNYDVSVRDEVGESETFPLRVRLPCDANTDTAVVAFHRPCIEPTEEQIAEGWEDSPPDFLDAAFCEENQGKYAKFTVPAMKIAGIAVIYYD